jgi:N-acetylmuramoyl-L-alanine amidase
MMPRIYTATFWLAAIMTACLSGTLEARNFRYVIIDPGHGGHDLGGHHGKVYEKHLALDTALRLEHYLKSNGIRTKITRRSDVFISLPGRTSIGNRYSNSIFVSIHYNHTWKRDPHGLEVHYHSGEGKKLAAQVQSKIMSKISTTDRGIKYARFYVLRHSKNPAILVECGFVTHSRERSKMKKAWFRQSLAEGIGQGIINFKKSR